MTRTRPFGAWIRPFAVLAALAGTFVLAGCGGGSGAPNNPYAPGPTVPAPLSILPPSATVYPGTPATLTIAGGTTPYRAYSSNPAVLPVATNVPGNQVVLLANATEADVTAAITIQDSGGQSVPVTVVVRPAPLFTGLTVLASGPECGSANLCSGSTGTASVAAKGVAGAPLAGRQVKFDVVYGPFAIQTASPAAPLAQTLTVVTDASGVARVGIQSAADATTQPAQIRATDLTTGQQVTGNFTIVSSSTTSAITVIPAKATITGAYKNECSAGFQVDYYIYGGNPPYRVSSTFPAAVSLLNPTVPASGGRFSAITNGACVDPLTFIIADAAGKQTTALLENLPGEDDRPVVPVADLSVQPSTVTTTGCTNSSKFQFVVVGGTAPYGVSTTNPAATVEPQPVRSSGGTFSVEPYKSLGAGTQVGSTTIVVLDSSLPQKSFNAVINCNP
ncbi:MAG: hypothetical protein IPG28_07725 [Betaproteobacteria bacterium]|jgi:hypothetical protein|nr:hypothetical protein [Betaproteobacteria bacterium]MBK7079682.1 hypothetical protein [Betaproteobacteria bacterium]MBK9677018.1 hypothetical protein [Betaproteobacteria bacterium]MBL0290870.1 hypothetical protein [Betaproteobacteria bacterium]